MVTICIYLRGIMLKAEPIKPFACNEPITLETIDALARALPSLKEIKETQLDQKWRNPAVSTKRTGMIAGLGLRKVPVTKEVMQPHYSELLSEMDTRLGGIRDYALLKPIFAGLILDYTNDSEARKMFINPQYREFFFQVFCLASDNIKPAEQNRLQFWRQITAILDHPEQATMRPRHKLFGLAHATMNTINPEKETNLEKYIDPQTGKTPTTKLKLYCEKRKLDSRFKKLFNASFSAATDIPKELLKPNDKKDDPLEFLNQALNMILLKAEGLILPKKRVLRYNLKTAELVASIFERKELYFSKAEGGCSGKFYSETNWLKLTKPPLELFATMGNNDDPESIKVLEMLEPLVTLSDHTVIYPNLKNARRKETQSISGKAIIRNSLSREEIIQRVPTFADETLFSLFFTKQASGKFFPNDLDMDILKAKALRILDKKNYAGFEKELLVKFTEKKIGDFTDLFGISIVVKDFQSMENIMRIVQELFRDNILEVEAYFTPPPANPSNKEKEQAKGLINSSKKPYRALHYIIRINDDHCFELQVYPAMQIPFKYIDGESFYKNAQLNPVTTAAKTAFDALWWAANEILINSYINPYV